MLPLEDDMMPMGSDSGMPPIEGAGPNPLMDEEDPVAAGLSGSLNGSHYVVLPPGVPAPTGMTTILPLPPGMDLEQVYAMIADQAAEEAGEAGGPPPPSMPVPPMNE